MVITSRTHTTLFALASSPSSSASGSLIRLPLSVVPHYERRCDVTGEIVPTSNKPLFRSNLWSSDEHERFLHGLEMFPNGPWKEIAKVVGTKSTRQTMTHAQKYRQKIERHMQTKEKAKSPKEKARRRTDQADDRQGRVASLMNEPSSHGSTMTFFDELVSCTPVEERQPMRVASPTDVYNDAFDTAFLDQEFGALLSVLEPLPQRHDRSPTYTDGSIPFFSVFA